MSVENSVAPEVKVMASIMNQIEKASFSLFNSRKTLRVSLEEYLHRIHHYSECHNSCFIMAMILIDRVMDNTNIDAISLPFNIHT